MPGRQKQILFGILALVAQFFAPLCQAAPPGYERDTRSYNLAHGRVVFTDKCMRCHESGRKGAPVFDDTSDWMERLEQPLDTLIRHALVGHGRMPAKGDQDISDQDVSAAVAYIVNRIRIIATREGTRSPASTSPEAQTLSSDSSDQAVVQMFLMLIGKDRWK